MDKFEAKCKVCLKAFDASNMGESALKSREKGRRIFILWKQNISFEDPEVEAYREQQLDYKKVDAGFVTQQVLKEKSEKFV